MTSGMSTSNLMYMTYRTASMWLIITFLNVNVNHVCSYFVGVTYRWQV